MSSIKATPITNGIILRINSYTITLTLSEGFRAGHVFEVKAAGPSAVDFDIRAFAGGIYGQFVYDMTTRIRLI